MSTWSKRTLLATAIALAPLSASPARAQVSVVDLAGIKQWVTQTAQQAQSYGTQLQQYRAQLAQYQNMLQNTANLPNQVWGQVSQDVVAVRNLSNAGNLLSGNTGSMLQRLGQANAYTNQAGSLLDMGAQLNQWQGTASQSMSSLGRVLGLQQVQTAQDANLIQQIQLHGQTAQGQMQVLQAGLEMTSVQSGQLARIQETLASTAAMTAARDAVADDRRGIYDASALRFSQDTIDRTPGKVW